VEEETQNARPVEPPLGMYPGRLDDKGRLKLPAEFQKFVGGLSEKRLFVTSLDRRIASIYPIGVWKQNEQFFEDFTEDPTLSENVAFNAADLGAEAEMDGQGRIQFPSKLRRDLDIENQPVHLLFYRGAVRVLSDSIYQERRTAASQTPDADVKALQRKGLK
jgi:MraZ protein